MSLPLPVEAGIDVERLADCVRRLDPGTRALLDLSVSRKLRDDALAPILHTDAFHLAWRRARALERVSGEMDDAPLAEVRAALEQLPRSAWDPLQTPALPSTTAKALVPVAAGPRGVVARLDAFAIRSPTLRRALADVGRAVGRKFVRSVIWRRER
jgi:hypothetical protein